MKAPACTHTLLILCGMFSALPAQAGDRMRPGLWVGTTVAGGRSYPSSSCVSQADAIAMNGDAKSVQGYLQRIIPVESCAVSGVKVDGSQITYAATCGGQPARVVTTVYHGTSFEGTDSSGSKTEAKLAGTCKQ
jgi:hypothetical protein